MVTEITTSPRPVARPEGLGLTDRDRSALLDATGDVTDGDVDALLDRAGVDGDTVEIPQNPAFDRIRDGSHVLMRGHTGDTVRAAQEHLIELGIMNPEGDRLQQADGIFGGQTEAAVRRFQEQRGLKVDGIIGQETIGALGPTSPRRSRSARKRAPRSSPASPIRSASSRPAKRAPASRSASPTRHPR